MQSCNSLIDPSSTLISLAWPTLAVRTCQKRKYENALMEIDSEQQDASAGIVFDT